MIPDTLLTLLPVGTNQPICSVLFMTVMQVYAPLVDNAANSPRPHATQTDNT